MTEKEQIKALIDDEFEAIDGYNEAIKLFRDNQEIVAKLNEIKAEEVHHVLELMAIANNL